MPRLALAFLGLTVGSSAFLASGLAGFLVISSLQDRVLLQETQRAPAVAVVNYVPDETIRVATLPQ
jgi:hypothetical protein